MLTSDDLAFVSVLAKSRSLAEGARALNVSAPAVTQRLQALEARVGVRLLDRSNRRLTMTDEGALVVEHGARVADEIEILAEALRNRRTVVGGHLSIAAPYGFGRIHIAPVVEAFALTHPQITVALDLSHHPSARLAESRDLVISIGASAHTDSIVTTLAGNRRILCASPSYVAASSAIGTPDDLKRHRCIVLRENDEDVTLWVFRDDRSRVVTVRVRPALSTNDGSVSRAWALAGLGIAIRSEWDVADDLERGLLLRVLPGWEVPPADVVAILGFRHGRSARAAALLAMLRRSFDPRPVAALTGGMSVSSGTDGAPRPTYPREATAADERRREPLPMHERVPGSNFAMPPKH